MRTNMMKTIPQMKTVTAYLEILFRSCFLMQAMFMANILPKYSQEMHAWTKDEMKNIS